MSYYGKEYDLFEYENCFTYYVFLCNDKLKKFRYITMEDYKDFHKDGVMYIKINIICIIMNILDLYCFLIEINISNYQDL